MFRSHRLLLRCLSRTRLDPFSTLRLYSEGVPPPTLPDAMPDSADSVLREFLADPDSFLQDSAVSSSLLPEPEAVLASVGFWGKIAFFQPTMVTLQQLTGMPFWATISAMALGLRLVALPFQLRAMKEEVRMRVYGPEIQRLDLLRKSAIDPEQKKIAGERLLAFTDSVEIRPSRRFLVLAPTAMFIPMFASLKLLCKMNLPAFSTGGALWFSNLAVPDPYFVLPLVNAGLLALNFFLAQRSSAKNVQLLQEDLSRENVNITIPPRNLPKIMKWVLYGTFAATGLITMKFSAGFFLFWIPTQLLSIGTTMVSRRWQRRIERDEILKSLEIDMISSSTAQEPHSRIIRRVDVADRRRQESEAKKSPTDSKDVTADEATDIDDLEESFFEDLESQ